MKTVLRNVAATAGVAVLLLAGVPDLEAETFTAAVVSGDNPARTTWDGQSADPPLQITIHLDAWSAPADVEEVKGTLATFGPSVMRRRGEERPLGRVIASSWEFPPGPWTVVLASVRETAAGRLVRLVTDRPAFVLSNWSQDAGFDPSTGRLCTGVIELTLDDDGKGTGVLMPVAAVVFDDEGGFVIEKASENVGAHKLIQVKAW